MARLEFIKCLTYRIRTSKLSTSAIRLVKDPLESRFVAKIFRKNQRKLQNIEGFSIFEMNIPQETRRKSKRQSLAKPIMAENNPKLKQTERIFHENISKIMQSGQISVTVPVTQVRLIRDFSQLNVYWEATGDSKQDKKIQNKLNSQSKSLRHFLLTSQESGYVPTITFLKDDSYVKEKKFDEYIRNLDIGQSDETGTRDTGEAQTGEPVNDAESLMQVHSQNVFNLRHDLLMKKVMNSKLKSTPEVTKDENEEERIDAKLLNESKRGMGVKQYSKLLGVYSKIKNQPRLEGNLTHLVPDILGNMERERELEKRKKEFKARKLAYFNTDSYRNKVKSLEDYGSEDSDDYGQEDSHEEDDLGFQYESDLEDETENAESWKSQ